MNKLIKNNDHPLLHPPTSRIDQDPETILWSRGNEIHHLGIWRRGQRTRREGRFNYRIPMRVWTGDVETRSWYVRRIWLIKIGEKESHQRFPRPHYWGVKSLIRNWDSSFSEKNVWIGGNDLIKKYRPSTNWLWDMIRVTFLLRIILTFLLTLGSNTTIY